MIPPHHHAPTLTAARWLMLVYVVVLPIVRPFDTRILGIHVFTADLIFAAVFFFWLFARCGRNHFFFNARYLAFVGSFFLALTASAAFSTEPQKSFTKLAGVFYLIAVSLVIADLVRESSFLKHLTYAWTVGSLITIFGTILGLVGFYFGYDSMATNFFLFHSGSLPPGTYPRVMAFFENPNMAANYTNVAALIVLGGGRIGWLPNKFALMVAAFLFIATVSAISPGIGGLILSIGLWIFLVLRWPDRRYRWVILAGCLIIAFLAFVSTAISPITRDVENAFRVPAVGRPIEPSVRLLVWEDSIKRALEYPILGRGTGTDAANLRYQVLSGQRQLLRDAHQAWLNVFGQAGIIGLLAFSALCWYLFSICRFRIRVDSDRETMLVAGSCAFAGAFLFQNLSGSFEDARHLWVLIGMLVGTSAMDQDS